MQEDGLELLLARQAGVVSRRQVLGLGLDDNHIRRLLRRREWATVHTGVYGRRASGPGTNTIMVRSMLRSTRAAGCALRRASRCTG